MNKGTFYESFLKKQTLNPNNGKPNLTTQFFEINLITRSFSYRDSDKVSEIKCIHTGKDLVDFTEQLEEPNIGQKAEWTYGFSLLTKARNYILFAQNFESYSKWMIMLNKYFKEPINQNHADRQSPQHFENFITYEDEDTIQILSSMNDRKVTEQHKDLNHSYGGLFFKGGANDFNEESNSKIDISRYFDDVHGGNIRGGERDHHHGYDNETKAFKKMNVYIPLELRQQPNVSGLNVSTMGMGAGKFETDENKGANNYETAADKKNVSPMVRKSNPKTESPYKNNPEFLKNQKSDGTEVTLVLRPMNQMVDKKNKEVDKGKQGSSKLIKQLFSSGLSPADVNAGNKEPEVGQNKNSEFLPGFGMQENYLREKPQLIGKTNVDPMLNKGTNNKPISENKPSDDDVKLDLGAGNGHGQPDVNNNDWNKDWFMENKNNFQGNNTSGFSLEMSMSNIHTTQENMRIEKLLIEKANQRNQNRSMNVNIASYFDEKMHHIKKPLAAGNNRIALENLHYGLNNANELPIDARDGRNNDKKLNNTTMLNSPRRRSMLDGQADGDVVFANQSVLKGVNDSNATVTKTITLPKGKNEKNEFTFNITVPENMVKVPTYNFKASDESMFENRMNADKNRARTKAISTKEYDGIGAYNDNEHLMFQRTFKDTDTKNTFVLNEHHMPIRDVIDVKEKMREETVIMEKIKEATRIEETGESAQIGDEDLVAMKENMMQELGFVHEPFTLSEGHHVPFKPYRNLKDDSILKEILKEENAEKKKPKAVFSESILNFSIEEKGPTSPSKTLLKGPVSSKMLILGDQNNQELPNTNLGQETSNPKLSAYEQRFQRRVSSINDISNISRGDFQANHYETVNESIQDLGGVSKLNFSTLNLDEGWDTSVLEDASCNDFFKKR